MNKRSTTEKYVSDKKRHFVLAILILAVCGQSISTFTSVILPLAKRVISVRALPVRERSAILSFGEDFSTFIYFLNDVIPENATVVIPPFGEEPVLGHEGIIQYFLFPRRITNCPRNMSIEQCTQMYSGENTYIIAVAGFPDRESAAEIKSLLPFDDQRGIYIPKTK